MKRITISLIVLFIIAGATFWLINQDTSDEGNENNRKEPAIEASSNNNEKSDTENSNNNEKKRLTDPIDILEYEGEECLALEDTIERGDCLQELGEENINWYMNEEKDEFYFPFQ